jgi:hypothetical protein
MSNSETERIAIEHVMRLERIAGRSPKDVRLMQRPYDVASPPRKIEVKHSADLLAALLSRWKPAK